MQNKTFHALVFLCIATIGCYATIAQVLLTREFLNIFYGNELCLGIVFGAWFLGIASGAIVGAKTEHAFQHAFSVFTITLLIMGFVLPAQILSVRGIRSLLNVGIGEYISLPPLILTAFGLVLPFSFIIGFIFPFSSKVICGITRDTAVDIGAVYIVESVGSLIGGLVFSFFMVSRFHPFKIVTLLNAGMFAFLTSLLFYFRGKEDKDKPKSILKFVSLALMLAILTVWFSPIPDKVETWFTKIRWNALNPSIELVASADSKYQHIDIGKQAEQYSIYLNGHYAAAFPNEYEYAQIAHLVMTQHPSPRHVLLLGNGLGGLISEMLLYPIETLDYVELDPNILQISDKYLSPSDKQSLSDKRVNIIHQDGRYHIKNTSKRQHYDIILINTPDPSTALLNRFYTLEFFKEAQDILKTNGVLATSVSSAVTYIGKEVGSYTGSLYHTLHEAFPYVRVTPGQTNFYFACNKEEIITLDIETLMERYRKFQVKSDYFTEYLFYTLLQPEQVAFIERQLSQRKDLSVNTDARPITYFLNLVLWDSLTGGRLHGLFHGLQNVGLKSFLFPIALALAGRLIYLTLKQWRSQRKDLKDFCSAALPAHLYEEGEIKKTKFDLYNTKHLRTNCLIALATTGFTGIALEIILLYAFQNIYGYLYEKMGVIVAVFMIGLALGGYIANRIIQKLSGRSRLPVATGNIAMPGNFNMKGWHGQTSLSVPDLTMCETAQSPTEIVSYPWVNVLMVFEGVIGVYALLLPFIIRALSFYSTAAEFALICLIGIAGILTGLEFPLVNKILIQSNKDIATSAGVTDSVDHIGAFFGAILTGVIFLPLLGVFGTCLILATLNISSLILIAFSIPWRKRVKYG